MKKTVVGITTLFFLILTSTPALPQLKKIRFSTTSIAVTELQFRIAHLKGFYREEGLDLETWDERWTILQHDTWTRWSGIHREARFQMAYE